MTFVLKLLNFQSQKHLIRQKSTRKERLIEYIKDKSIGKKTTAATSQTPGVDSNNNTSQNNGGINGAKKPQEQASSSSADKGSENKGLAYYVFDEDDEIQ